MPTIAIYIELVFAGCNASYKGVHPCVKANITTLENRVYKCPLHQATGIRLSHVRIGVL